MTKPIVVAATQLSNWLEDGLGAHYRLIAMGNLSPEDRNAATILVTTGTFGADRDTINSMPSLELIAVHGVGLDAVDTDYARSRGIRLVYTPDVLTDDVADMALALVLAALRRIVANDASVRNGDWTNEPPRLGQSATGRRYGIVGLGRIGKAIARRLEPLSPHIAYHNRSPVEASRYRYVDSVLSLARESEVLIVAAAGGAESRHLIDASVLEALGPEGTLINIGRGSSVDENALIEAVQKKRLLGAGLDVFADEPNIPLALRALDSVVLQPHQASSTFETRQAMARLVIDNLDAYRTGAPLLTPV